MNIDSIVHDLKQSRFARLAIYLAALLACGIGGAVGAGPSHWYENYNAKNSRAWMIPETCGRTSDVSNAVVRPGSSRRNGTASRCSTT